MSSAVIARDRRGTRGHRRPAWRVTRAARLRRALPWPARRWPLLRRRRLVRQRLVDQRPLHRDHRRRLCRRQRHRRSRRMSPASSPRSRSTTTSSSRPASCWSGSIRATTRRRSTMPRRWSPRAPARSTACARNTSCSNPPSASRKPTSPRRPRRRLRRADAARYRSLAQTAAGSRQDAAAHHCAGAPRRRPPSCRRRRAGRPRGSSSRCWPRRSTEAEAAVAQARADLQTAQLNLGYTEIRAPIDGYVGNRAAQVGAYVTAGTYLISVIPADGLWVDANFKEDQLARMVPGQPATVAADVLPGHVLPWPRRQPRARHRRGLQRHPAGERHRQLHQDRAARAGARHARCRRCRAAHAAAGLSTTASVDTRAERRQAP